MTIIILLSHVHGSAHRFLHRRCKSSPEVVGAGLVPARMSTASKVASSPVRKTVQASSCLRRAPAGVTASTAPALAQTTPRRKITCVVTVMAWGCGVGGDASQRRRGLLRRLRILCK